MAEVKLLVIYVVTKVLIEMAKFSTKSLSNQERI